MENASQRDQTIGLLLSRQTGEIILQTAIMNLLRQRFPHARLVAAIHDQAALALENNPTLDQVLPFSRERGGASVLARVKQNWDYLSLIKKVALDVVIDFHGGDRSAIQAWCSQAPMRISFAPLSSWAPWKRRVYTHFVDRPADNVSLVARYLRLLEPLGIKATQVPAPTLRLSKAELRHARSWHEKLGGEYAVLQLTSPRSSFHGLEEAQAAALLDWIQTQLGLKACVICGGPEREMQSARKIIDLCRRKPSAEYLAFNLREQAALMTGSKLFVGRESAVAYLAAAAGIGAVVLAERTGLADAGAWMNRCIWMSGAQPQTAGAERASSPLDLAIIKEGCQKALQDCDSGMA